MGRLADVMAIHIAFAKRLIKVLGRGIDRCPRYRTLIFAIISHGRHLRPQLMQRDQPDNRYGINNSS